MSRKAITALLGVLILSGTVSAQVPARLRWSTGQVLVYKVDQTIAVTEVAGENKSVTTIKVSNTKRWQVLAVDAAGVATLQHSLVVLRQETTTPDGRTLLFDSAAPDKSTPELKDAMTKYVGTPLAVLRVDSLGRVLEVKESKFGPAYRYESELPFVGVLPTENLKVGTAWERSYNLSPDPNGASKFPAVQRYVCKTLTNNAAVVAVRTEMKAWPEVIADRAPLLQMQAEGEISYDLVNGRLYAASLRVDKELKDFQGEGSNLHVVATYVEQLVGDR